MKEILIAFGTVGLFVLGAARGAVIQTRNLSRDIERDSLVSYKEFYVQGKGVQEFMVIKELDGQAEHIFWQFIDPDRILWAAYVNDEYIFDYNKDSEMYIGWTKDEHGYRDYVVWYDDTLPGPVWYLNR